MKKLIRNPIALIGEIVVLILSIVWYIVCENEAAIGLIISAIGLIITYLFSKGDNNTNIVGDNNTINIYTGDSTERVKELEGQLENNKKLSEYEKREFREEIAKLKETIEHKNKTIAEIKEYNNKVEEQSPLYQKAYGFFEKGDKESALEVLSEDNLQNEEQKIVDARILKAQMLELEFKFEEAEINYLKAVNISPSFYNNFIIARFYQELNQHHKAIKYYKICLEKTISDDERATTLNNLGVLQRDTNDLDKAKESYEEALAKYRKLAQANPQAYLPYVATTLNNLGNLQRDTNDLDKAKESYEEALAKYRKLAQANPQAYLPDVAMTLNNLGILQSDTNDLDKAKESYEEALEIRKMFPHLRQ